jgi:hypothetical protein
MRTIRPDRSEHAKIKRAFRAATFMKWGLVPLMLLAVAVAVLISSFSSRRYLGYGFLALAWGALLFFGTQEPAVLDVDKFGGPGPVSLS